VTSTERALEGVIFDLDGTVTDTLSIAFSAFRAAVAEFTPDQFTDKELMRFFGPTEDGILRQILPHDWELCFERYLDEYASRHVSCSAPFPGMTSVLDFLKGQRIPMALVTGKAPRAVAITLKQVDIAHYFDMIEMGSPEGSVKPQALSKVIDKWRVNASCVAHVGDAISDKQDRPDRRWRCLGQRCGCGGAESKRCRHRFHPYWRFIRLVTRADAAARVVSLDQLTVVRSGPPTSLTLAS
jgi:pyrophosphatase PpaX